MMIPIFDSLAHPTLTGEWLGQGRCSTFTHLVEGMRKSNFLGACAIGMAGIENYSHERFMVSCRKYDCLVPVAGVSMESKEAISMECKLLRELGYRAIKIHPRFLGKVNQIGELREWFQAAAEENFVIFYCTYMHGHILDYPKADPLYSLLSLLEEGSSGRVVLIHGGDVNLMRYMELVRFNSNLLLDLSLTMMKYRGSSIDLDIRFLFKHFDQRVCIGTDFPEYSPEEVRERFEELAVDVMPSKLENIAFRNLCTFLEIDCLEFERRINGESTMAESKEKFSP